MKQRTKVIVYIFLIAMIIGVNIFVNNKLAQIGYNIESLKREITKIRNENKELEYLIAQRSNLEQIDKISTTKLKMEYPITINYILVTAEEK